MDVSASNYQNRVEYFILSIEKNCGILIPHHFHNVNTSAGKASLTLKMSFNYCSSTINPQCLTASPMAVRAFQSLTFLILLFRNT